MEQPSGWRHPQLITLEAIRESLLLLLHRVANQIDISTLRDCAELRDIELCLCCYYPPVGMFDYKIIAFEFQAVRCIASRLMDAESSHSQV